MDITRTITVSQPFTEVAQRVREALAAQGFGVLTEIDMTATIKEKRGADIEDFLVLGACNPELASARCTSTDGSGSCCRATSSSARPPTAPTGSPRSWS